MSHRTPGIILYQTPRASPVPPLSGAQIHRRPWRVTAGQHLPWHLKGSCNFLGRRRLHCQYQPLSKEVSVSNALPLVSELRRLWVPRWGLLLTDRPTPTPTCGISLRINSPQFVPSPVTAGVLIGGLLLVL